MNLKEEVTKLVQDWTAQAKSFTAFEVTVQIRADHPGEAILHNDVKSIVHTLFLGGELPANYTRTSAPFGAGSAWVYHDVANPPQPPAPAPSLGQQVGNAVKGILNGLQFWKS